MVSGVLRRWRIGISISSADDWKKDMTVLSANLSGNLQSKCSSDLPAVRNMETCSALTACFRLVIGECPSMNAIRSSLGPPWYLCNVRNFCTPASGMPSVCPTTNPFAGSWTPAIMLAFLCCSVYLEFENIPRRAFDIRPRFRFFDVPILSVSSAFESLSSESGCR